MPYEIDQDIELAPRTQAKYFISSAHRRKLKNKSRWTITRDEEVECFIDSHTSNWIENDSAWGLISNGNNLKVLGINGHDEELRIAKFVAKNQNNVWHGYPADFCRNHQDRPGMLVLKDWRQKNHIEKHHMVKIRQGKECNL